MRLLFFIGDLIYLNFSVFISFIMSGRWDATSMSDKAYLFIFTNLSWLYLTLVANPYKVNKGWSLSRAVKTQFAFILIHLLVVASLIFFFRKDYAPAQIALIYVVFVPIYFLWKTITFYLRKVFTVDLLNKNYILVGQNSTSREVRKYYLTNPELGYRFLGYVELAGNADELLQRIKNFTDLNEVHEIFCCTSEISNDSLKSLVEFGLDSLIKVKIVAGSTTENTQAIRLDRADQDLRRNVAVVPLDEGRHQVVKRIFDLLFSITFILLAMSWLLPIIAIIIRIDSKGPVFFVQPRSGRFNNPFNCLKFRTMRVNVDANLKQATKDDPRITKLGAFLRKSSIDELPQFINVLLGDMSVVGPRPHMLKHTEEYSKLIEKFMGRQYVKPGITGLAQCMGYRGETQTLEDMENRVRLDRYYIENWTFWLDIKIIFLTVVSLIRGSDKAY